MWWLCLQCMLLFWVFRTGYLKWINANSHFMYSWLHLTKDDNFPRYWLSPAEHMVHMQSFYKLFSLLLMKVLRLHPVVFFSQMFSSSLARLILLQKLWVIQWLPLSYTHQRRWVRSQTPTTTIEMRILPLTTGPTKITKGPCSCFALHMQARSRKFFIYKITSSVSLLGIT